MADTTYPTIDRTKRETLHFEGVYRVRNTYGNVYVSVPQYRVANVHGYGHHLEHAATVRSRALRYVREVLGSNWAIVALLHRNIVSGENVITYSAVKIGK